MSFGSQTISTVEPKIGALSIQNSAFGLPITLFWGKARLSGNMIWYGDFTAIAHTTVTESGGKGGGGVTSKNTSFTYTTAFIFGLCEGALSSIETVWAGKEKTTFAALGMTLLPGTLPQAVWSHLTSKHPTQALSYPGIACAAHSAFDLKDGASLPNLSFESNGPRQFGSGISDARPDEIITDLTSNDLYGAGFPASRLSLASYRTYTQANGLFLSPVITNQQPAATHIDGLTKATNSACLWSEGLLKIIPYGDTVISGNGTTYTPAITPQYDLTDDDFLINGVQPPIKIKRKRASDAFNQVQVEFRNRANDYNIEIAEAKDLGSISAYGLRADSPISIHSICERSVADKVVNMILQRKLYVRNTYEFTLGWRHCLLEPMDIVTLTHSQLGLALFQVRITRIEEDANGKLSIEAEEFPFGVATPAAIQTQVPSGYTVDTNVPPGNANAPVVFEPPLSLSLQPEVWLATSGDSPWGGAEVWISLDNATYKQVGITYGSARHGVLSAAFANGTDPDTTNALAVDLVVSKGTLLSGTLQDRDLYNTLCYVDGELISYQTATLTALNKYSLTSLRRGAHGTTAAAHSAGTKFARLDTAIFRFAYTPEYVGKTIYIKLRSFNSYGAAHQELSGITPTTYLVVGAPMGAITGFVLAQPWIGTTLSVKWNAYAGATSYKMEVWVLGVLKRTVSNITETAFDYTLDDNVADGGPSRSIELRVFAKHSTGQSTTAATLVATNPQITVPTGVSVTPSVGQINLQATTPTDVDYAGTIIWAGNATGFVRNDASKVYDGPTPVFSHILGAAVATTKFYRIAHYDKLGKDSLNETTEFTATSIIAGGVPTVSTLPGSTYLGDDVVFYDGDGKLYRWFGDAYTRAADGGDLIGASVTADKITTTNLSAISSNLGTILAGNMTLDAAGFIRGGSTGYMTGPGFWMGNNAGAYKFHIGNPAGQHLRWDGAGLTMTGALSAATGTFSGELVAASGTFGGSLLAGVIDFTTYAGQSATYGPGTYTLVVPAGKRTMRVTLWGAGGGGGGGYMSFEGTSESGDTTGPGGAGGGGGGYVQVTLSNLTAGQTYTLVVGVGGANGISSGWPNQSGTSGSAGGTTYLSGIATLTGGQGGQGAFHNLSTGAMPVGGAGGSYGGGDGFPPPPRGGSYCSGGSGGLNPSSASIGHGGTGGATINVDYYASITGTDLNGMPGSNGRAIVEYYEPNSVVLQTNYQTLLGALTRQGIATE